jgi:putative spermidine/putrescine transport system permease protein
VIRNTKLAWFCLTPTVILLLPLIAASLVVIRLSFGVKDAEWSEVGLGAYVQLASPFFVRSFVLTLRLAAESAVLDVLLAVPVALVLSRIRNRFWRRVCLLAVLMPLLVNLLLQSYGWLVVLGPAGVVNRTFIDLGFIERPLRLLYAEPAVLIGLVQTALPLAVLPITQALRGVPVAMEEAAATLGARRGQILRQITIPIALPAIVAAGTLVFAYNASAFAVPLLLGAGRVQMLGVVVHTEVAPLFDFPQASSASVVLTVAALLLTSLVGLWGRRKAA